MKTVLHLIETSGPGGAEKMLISLLAHLDTKRYRSIVGLHKGGWLKSQLEKRGFRTFIIPQRHLFDFGWIVRVIRLLKDEGVDLIHAHEFAMNVYGTLVSTLTGVPIITTVHGKNYYWKKWRRKWAYRFVASRSQMVAVSEDTRQFLIEKVGIVPAKVKTIYNGIDVDLYKLNQTERCKIRQELEIGDHQMIVGAVGNLYPVKGHTFLIKACALVIKDFPSVMFLIAGRGELLEELQREAIELKVERNVIFLGFREDISSFLHAIDIFALPSLSEGLSLALLEAMAAEKPVVATKVGGNPEVVQEGETGFLVPPEDPRFLARCLLILLQNRSLTNTLGAAGRKRVESFFSLQNMVACYQALYNSTMA